MSFIKNNFKDGDVLTADSINKIENEILQYGNIICENIRQLTKLITFPYFTINGNVAVLGDSTISGYPSYPRLSTYFSIKSGCTLSDISTPGDTLKGQLSKWKALDSDVKSNINYIFCQIGLNDVDETKENFRTYYKELISQMRQDAPNAKIILGTMLPCKKRWEVLYPGDNNALKRKEFQERWESANYDIKNGYYDCDAVAFIHTEALGIDNVLRKEYDHNDAIHEKPEGAKIIVYSWLSAAFANLQ